MRGLKDNTIFLSCSEKNTWVSGLQEARLLQRDPPHGLMQKSQRTKTTAEYNLAYAVICSKRHFLLMGLQLTQDLCVIPINRFGRFTSGPTLV